MVNVNVIIGVLAFLTPSIMSTSHQPLLNDDDNDDELPPLRTGHAVRFKEDVQVIAPSLRSTISSREAGRYVAPSSNPTCNQLTFQKNMTWIQTTWMITFPMDADTANNLCHSSSASSIPPSHDKAWTDQFHSILQAALNPLTSNPSWQRPPQGEGYLIP